MVDHLPDDGHRSKLAWMAAPTHAEWFQRLEERRKREGLSMKALAARLNLGSPQTIYNWRLGSSQPSRSAVRAIAQFLGESEGDLQIEMGSAGAVGPDERVATLMTRRLNAQWHQVHLRDIRALLGASDADGRFPEIEDVDLVVARLRKSLPGRLISILRSRRGTVLRVPYEYLLHVEPDPTVPRTSEDSREQLEKGVLRALTGLRGPTWWDRSNELLPRGWDPDGVTLVYPHLLESRPPDWQSSRYEPADRAANLFVLSVYHGGAPDVGALLADCLGFGYNTLTNLAAQLGSWTVEPLRTSREIGVQTDLARAITTQQSPIAGPFVWSINDPEPMLDDGVRRNLVHHPSGRVIFLKLSREALDYAAWQVAATATRPATPSPEQVREQRDQLSRQQAGLERIAVELEWERADDNLVFRLAIELPSEVGPLQDGSYPDAEDHLFDRWALAALEARKWLDQFDREGQIAPGDDRIREIIREGDLLGPLVHHQHRQPAASTRADIGAQP